MVTWRSWRLTGSRQKSKILCFCEKIRKWCQNKDCTENQSISLISLLVSSNNINTPSGWTPIHGIFQVIGRLRAGRVRSPLIAIRLCSTIQRTNTTHCLASSLEGQLVTWWTKDDHPSRSSCLRPPIGTVTTNSWRDTTSSMSNSPDWGYSQVMLVIREISDAPFARSLKDRNAETDFWQGSALFD